MSAPLFAAAAGARADTRAGAVERRALAVELVLAEQPVAIGADEEELAADAHDVFFWLERHPFAVVSGEPGSGKTWLLDQIADELSGRLSGPAMRALPDHLAIPISLRGTAIEQLFVSAEGGDKGEHAGANGANGSNGANGPDSVADTDAESTGLDALINRWLSEVAEATGLDVEALQPFFDLGRWVVLIDGLDAVTSPERRQIVWRWLAEHQVRHAGRGYYVVATRPSGLRGLSVQDASGDAVLASDLLAVPDRAGPDGRLAAVPRARVVHVRPLSEERAHELCLRTNQALGVRPDAARRGADQLLDAAADDDDIRELLRRPGWCVLMAAVGAGGRGHGVERGWSRVALYRRALDAYFGALVERLSGQLSGRLVGADGQPVRLARARGEHITLLGMLAYLAHSSARRDDPAGYGEEGAEGAAGFADDGPSWSRAYLRDLMRRLLTRDEFQILCPDHADALLGAWLDNPIVLRETRDGSGEVCFAQASLQEFLAAVHLHGTATAVVDKCAYVTARVFPHLGEPSWDEVASWILAMDASATGGRGHRALLSALDVSREAHAYWLAELLGSGEVPFAAHERLAWIGGLMAAAMVNDWRDIGESMAHHSGNREAVARLLEQAAVPWLDRKWPRQRARRVVERPAPRPTNARTIELALAAEPLGEARDARRAVADNQALWRVDGHWDMVRAEREVAAAAYMAGDVGVALADEQVVLLVPPQLFACTDEGLLAFESFWALQGLVRPDTPLLARALRARCHPGAWLALDEASAPAWLLGQPSAPESEMRSALETALYLAASTPETGMVEAWLLARARAVALSLASAQLPSRQQALDRAREAARANKTVHTDVLQRARSLARALPLSLALAHSQTLPRDRASSLARSRVAALARALLGAGALPDLRNLATAVARVLGRELPASSEERLWSLVTRLGFLAEAMLMTRDPKVGSGADGADVDAPVTEERAQQAARVFADAAWIESHDDGDRLAREFRECQELGLFPTALLSAATRPDSWLRGQALRPSESLAALVRELDAIR